MIAEIREILLEEPKNCNFVPNCNFAQKIRKTNQAALDAEVVTSLLVDSETHRTGLPISKTNQSTVEAEVAKPLLT